jgi:hypothetical protein
MTPESQAETLNERPSVAVMMRLTGTCGHEINVLIRDRGEDLTRISEAMDQDKSEALLTRFCPFCMADREFAYPLFDLESRTSTLLALDFGTTAITSFQPFPDWMPDISLPPAERAFRLWGNGKSNIATKPEQAERELKLAADLFDRQRKTMQYEAVLEDLIELYESQGRLKEAAELREKIR